MDTQYRLIYPQTVDSLRLPHQLNASMPDSTAWRDSSSSSSPSEHSSQVYSMNHSPDQVNYATLSAPFISQHQTSPYPSPPHQQSPHSDSIDNDMSSTLPQVDSSVGPNRVLTRRQRALQRHGGRRVSDSSSLSAESKEADEQQSPMFYIHSEASRPQTPHTANTVYPSPQETLPLGTDSNDVALQVQSPRYPSTTAPVTSGYPSYALYPTHSPSTSTSNSNPRSASPALSAVSALTTVSSHSTPTSQTLTPFPLPQIGTLTPIAPRQKQRKQRLFNVDRKAICVYQRDHPLQRQEDIAMRYGVERSTISKILKHKTKWLNVPEHDELRVAKHRPSKFPDVEEQLHKWLLECKKNSVILTDAMIRQKAKETARYLGISDDKFKASSGWVENFKHRHGIRGGMWHGDGKIARIARSIGSGPYETDPNVGSIFIPVYPSQYDAITIEPHTPGARLGRTNELNSSVPLQPAWQRQPDGSSPLNISMSSIPSPNQPHHSSMHEASPQHLLQHHHEAAMHLDHIPLSSHDHLTDANHQPDSHQDPSAAYDSLDLYQTTRPMHSPLEGAEEALDKVISFIDTQGQDVFSPDERRRLNQIRSALFQGAPFNRSSR